MRNRAVLGVLLIFLLSNLLIAQFTMEEVKEFKKWEKWLEDAEVLSGEQMDKRVAVTEPWILEMENDGITAKGLWKNPQGRMKGYMEGWKWEIAAYKLSNYLELYMVPPTVEKRYKGNLGSCQLWKEGCRSLREIMEGISQKTVKIPGQKRAGFFRALSLQRAFDNLIANEDRHQNQYLVTDDWRMILVDHSRSFRTTKKFTTNLIYDEKHKDGLVMNDMPKKFYEKIKSLNFDIVRQIVGSYLTDKEIEALLKRKELIITFMDKRIKELGEVRVLY